MTVLWFRFFGGTGAVVSSGTTQCSSLALTNLSTGRKAKENEANGTQTDGGAKRQSDNHPDAFGRKLSEARRTYWKDSQYHWGISRWECGFSAIERGPYARTRIGTSSETFVVKPSEADYQFSETQSQHGLSLP